ncbi:serine protease SP24D-like [Ochlerotatus camptorhynchus]|uniref:serine protease SP24D-like n=1 Tax=Ochlerotatus camptorhynchus TaxID=644619 RepID=UPI0031D85CDE
MAIRTTLVVLLSVAFTTLALPEQKIVGGQFAEEHQFPYQIGLFLNGEFHCGGSIIDSQWVLTAAHCVWGAPPSSLQVYVGSSNLTGSGHLLDVEDTFAHEAYGEFKNDIALMKLKQNIQFDDSIQKIELYSGEELKESSQVIISGFGRIGTGMSVSDQLKFNTMYVVRDEVCYEETGIRYEGVICFNSGVDNGACNGDSGGPAVYEGQLVGVANFVIDGCGTQYPDGYAKVAYFVDWIQETLETN